MRAVKTSLLQSYEVLWIHVVDTICTSQVWLEILLSLSICFLWFCNISQLQFCNDWKFQSFKHFPLTFQVVGIPFIICFLCGLCQNDFIRQRRIHRQNLENSRFTRNQQRFNLLNSTSEVNGYTFEVNGYDACNDSITFEKQQLCSKIWMDWKLRKYLISLFPEKSAIKLQCSIKVVLFENSLSYNDIYCIG